MKPSGTPRAAHAPAPGRSRRLRRRVGVLLASLAVSGCGGLPEAKVWNLHQVHGPDGRPRYQGSVQSDTQYRLRRVANVLASTGGPDFGTSTEQTIENPLGVGLENALELQHTSTKNKRIESLKVQTFTWLAVDCSYALTRERSLRALRKLAMRYGVDRPITLAPDIDAIDPDEMRELLKEIVPPARELLDGSPEDRQGTADRLAAGCAAIDFDRLDSNGARRLLSVMNVLMERGSFDRPLLAPLAELEMSVGHRAIGLALDSGLRDESGFVRATSVEVCSFITEGGAPAILRAGIGDPDPMVVTRALKMIARFGLPTAEDEWESMEATPEEYEAAWLDLMAQVLQAVFDGEIAVAACEAMARATGKEQNLRPEHWVAWWTVERESFLEP